MQEIRDTYGYKYYTEQDEQSLINIMLPNILENDSILNVMNLAITEIKNKNNITGYYYY